MGRTQTAIDSYNERSIEVAGFLNCILQELSNHSKRMLKDPKNWGFTGDLEHVRAQLKEVLVFLLNMDSKEEAKRAIKRRLAKKRASRR